MNGLWQSLFIKSLIFSHFSSVVIFQIKNYSFYYKITIIINFYTFSAFIASAMDIHKINVLKSYKSSVNFLFFLRRLFLILLKTS